jgi:hypothetical protein
LKTITRNAFEWSELSFIVLPKGLISIQKRAFYHCCLLRSITLPSTLKTIGTEAFSRAAIEALTIPESLETIGEGAFDDCRALRTLTFCGQSRLSVIGASAFAECGFSELNLHASVSKIKTLAFDRCFSLKSLTVGPPCRLSCFTSRVCNATGLHYLEVPPFVKTIELGTFSYCYFLEKLTFSQDSKLESIGDRAFYGCVVSTLRFPDSLREICFEAFAQTRFLTKVSFGSNLTGIGKNAFMRSGITEITVSDSTRLIESGAFLNTRLTPVTFGSGLVDIGADAFSRNPIVWISPIPNSVHRIGPMAFCRTLLTRVLFCENSQLVEFHADAFMNCSALPSVKLPLTVRVLGSEVTDRPIYVLSRNLLPSTGEDGFSGKEAQSQINRIIVADLTYDPQVQFLKSHVRLVRIPAFVEELPVRSFSECHALEKVLFDVSSRLAVIGKKAFRWSSIRAVSFPASLQSIEDQAFDNCPRLTEIDYPSNSSLVSIGREAFKSTHLHDIHFPDSLKFIKERAFFATLYLRRITFGMRECYGEYLINAQGEDVVAGIRTPQPIAALKNDMPKVFDQLVAVCKTLEDHFRDMQDFEFTREQDKLYMLQTRNGKRTGLAAVRIAVEMVDEKRISKEEAVQHIPADSISSLLVPVFDEKEKKEFKKISHRVAGGTWGGRWKGLFLCEKSGGDPCPG